MTQSTHSPNMRLLSALGCAVFCLGTLAAQEAPRQEPGEVVAQEVEKKKEDRGKKHVIHMNNGQVLRVRARQAEGGWEIRQGKSWRMLPDAAIDRAVLEKDLLSQARGLERDLKKTKDPVRHVAYADWLMQEGLRQEAVQRLDRVLRGDPDQPEALAVIARSDVNIGLPSLDVEADQLPAALDRFFAFSAQVSPSGREMAVGELREHAQIPGLVDTLRREMVTKTVRRRSFATLAMRRIFPGREVRALLSRSILDRSQEVRTGASLGLRDVEDAAVVLPALRALGSRNSEVRKNAVQALGTMNYAVAVEPLITHLSNLQSGNSSGIPRQHIFFGRQIAYVQDFDVEVAQAQAIADPVVNVLQEGEVLDVAVRGVTAYIVQTERATVRRSLSQLTGAKPGNTTAAWMRWWEKNGDEWKAGASPSGPPSSPKSPGR